METEVLYRRRGHLQKAGKAEGELQSIQLQTLISPQKRIIAKLGISIYDRIQHSLMHTNLMKEGQGIREYTDVGQEGPNQSNNTSGRCSIFSAEFSRGLLDLYPQERDSRARQAHTVTIAGRQPSSINMQLEKYFKKAPL